ncbi:helix-turn-helix domain-containing protein [Paracoccus endophyticus]|uniref:helix-turn-helix domain-containing protein n=1 Tax=Paracoccus endophyticus TaxID=2233774 RepID=UPI000DD520BF|nr:helix-turn-helix domain-containing protein [Paracoccus endophyticus]
MSIDPIRRLDTEPPVDNRPDVAVLAPTLIDPPESAAPAARVPANDTRPAPSLRPYAARPRPPATGVRLVPLADFVWGGAGRLAARARGDHCLIRVTAGAMRILLPRGHADHARGSVIFIPAGTAFGAQPQPGAAGQVPLMTRECAAGLDVPLPGGMVVGAGASDAFSADLAALAARALDPLAAATAACRIGLISAQLHRLAAGGPLDGPAHDRRIVADFMDLAARELGRGRTLADLADALGISAGALDRACRAQRGRSALDLIYDLRLARARALLADRSRSLGQIADALGFTGAAHLNRAFMAATGRPADAFRPA